MYNDGAPPKYNVAQAGVQIQIDTILLRVEKKEQGTSAVATIESSL